MIIRNKFNGYVNGNNRLYPGGGGGPTTTYSQTSNIPEYAEPYVQTMLGSTEKQIYKTDPTGAVTGFQPYQSYAQYAQGQGQSGESVAGFSPMQTQAMRGIQGYQLPGQTEAASQMTAGLTGAAIQPSSFRGAGTAESYMSPYIQQALAPQMEEARRQYGITGQQQAGQAVQQGAFGGARHGIVEAENARNLAKQQESIYGQGMQAAFGQGQQQYNTEQQQRAAQIQQGLGGAGQLAALGQQQYGQQTGLMGQQLQVGAQQQAYEQQRMNQVIQDYATSQQYPMMQLGVLSNMLRGLPMQAASTQMYQAQPSAASQMAGLAGTGMGIYNQGKTAGAFKKGGVVKMASGGIATGVPPEKLPYMLKKLSDEQLSTKQADKGLDPETMSDVVTEAARRKEMRGLASGGIIAFADGGETYFDRKKAEYDAEHPPVARTKEEEEAPESQGIRRDLISPAVANAQQGITNPEPTQAPAPAPVAAAVPVKDQLAEDLAAQAEQYRTKFETPAATRYADMQKEREALGIVNPYKEDIDKAKARKAEITGSANEEYMNRLSEFLMTWGTIAGPTAVAAAKAGKEIIPKMVDDRKERKRLLSEMDGVISGINKSVYLEKTGDYDKAKAEKEEAGKNLFALNSKLLEAQTQIGAKNIETKGAMQRVIATLASEEKRALLKNAIDMTMKEMEVNKPTDFKTGVENLRNAMVQAGAPDDARTTAAATEKVYELTKGLDAKMLQAMAAQTSAGAAVKQAGVAGERASVATSKERGDMQKDFNEAVDDAARTTVNAKRLRTAKEADKAAGRKVDSPDSAQAAVYNKIKAEVLKEPGYEMLRAPSAPAAAPGTKPPAGFKVD